MAIDESSKNPDKSQTPQAHGEPSVGVSPVSAPSASGFPHVPDRGPQFSLGQRTSIGVNVAVMLAAATALLVLVNYIASAKPVHRDWSSAGRYSLSERTRKIVEGIDKPITLTILYDSKEKIRDKVTGTEFKSSVMELAEEIRAAGKDVKIIDITGPDQRYDLAKRLEDEQKKAAGGFVERVTQFQAEHQAMEQALANAQKQLGALLGDQKWVASFDQPHRAYDRLEQVAHDLGETALELKKLQSDKTEGAEREAVLTAFDKQAEVLKAALSKAARELEETHKAFGELADLHKKIASDDGGVVKNSKLLASQIDKEFQALDAKLLAAQTHPPATSQPAEQFIPHVEKIIKLLGDQGKLLTQFAADQPAIRTCNRWLVPLSPTQISTMEGIFHVPAKMMTEQVADELPNIETGADFMMLAKTYLARVREAAQVTTALFARLDKIFDAIRQIDPESQQLLDDVKGGKFLPLPEKGLAKSAAATVLAEVTRLRDDVEKFQPTGYRGLSDKFKQDNVVLVEVAGKPPRAMDFNEVWPLVASAERGEDKDKAPQRRTFNGDPAIGSALLSLAVPRIAEVVFVYFATEGQRNPMTGEQQPGNEGEISIGLLKTLHDRLEKADIRVTKTQGGKEEVGWNLATTLEPPPPAYADEDTPSSALGKSGGPASQPEVSRKPLPRVYVVLPPPPTGPYGSPDTDQPPPENQYQPPQKRFGSQERQALAEALRHGGRAIFLATYYPRQNPYTGESEPMKYEWNSYLDKEWGMKVLNDMRVVQGIPTPRDGQWRINPTRFYQALCNQFNRDHPVGRPLLNRRVLLLVPAPIEVDDKPKGVTHQTILEVPQSDRAFWATRQTAEAILEQVHNQDTVQFASNDKKPPFNLMVEADRTDAAGQKSAIILFSAGLSFFDPYLKEGGLRLSEEEGMQGEPPPDVNPEIVINSVYYLAGQQKWIAMAPVAVPPINVQQKQLLPIRIAVVGGLPLLVLLAGGAVSLVRRRRA